MIIIFVCTGNTCRSPMAEAIAKDFFQKNNLDIDVLSAGIQGIKGAHVNLKGKKALENIGLSGENHRSQRLTLELIKNADKVLTMTKRHKEVIKANFSVVDKIEEKVETLTFFVTGKEGDIIDPFMGSLTIYEACRDLIKELIEKGKWEDI